MGVKKHNVFRDGKVHICKRMCSTCVFRPGNLMNLEPGRVDGMVEKAVASDSTIVCHQTLDGPNAGCRGFYDHHATPPLQIAVRVGMVEWVEPPGKSNKHS